MFRTTLLASVAVLALAAAALADTPAPVSAPKPEAGAQKAPEIPLGMAAGLDKEAQAAARQRLMTVLFGATPPADAERLRALLASPDPLPVFSLPPPELPLGVAAGDDKESQAAARQRLMTALFSATPPADAERLRALLASPDPLPVAERPAPPLPPPPYPPQLKAEPPAPPLPPPPAPAPIKTVPGLIGSVDYVFPDSGETATLWEFPVADVKSWPMFLYSDYGPTPRSRLKTVFPVTYTGVFFAPVAGRWSFRVSINNPSSENSLPPCRTIISIEAAEIGRFNITDSGNGVVTAELPEAAPYELKFSESCVPTRDDQRWQPTDSRLSLEALPPGATTWIPAPVGRPDRPLAMASAPAGGGAGVATIRRGGTAHGIKWLETVRNTERGGVVGDVIAKVPHRAPSALEVTNYTGGTETKSTPTSHQATLTTNHSVSPGRWIYLVALEQPSRLTTYQVDKCRTSLTAEDRPILAARLFSTWNGSLTYDNSPASLAAAGAVDVSADGKLSLALTLACDYRLPQIAHVWVRHVGVDPGIRPIRDDEVNIHVDGIPDAAAPSATVSYAPPVQANAIASALQHAGDQISLVINFEFNSDKISPSSQDQIKEIAAGLTTLLAAGGNGVAIEGHTDNVGADAYNMDLSKRRALAVGMALFKLGVDTHRLLPLGLGASKPVADNGTEAGRAQNRRVVLRRL